MDRLGEFVLDQKQHAPMFRYFSFQKEKEDKESEVVLDQMRHGEEGCVIFGWLWFGGSCLCGYICEEIGALLGDMSPVFSGTSGQPTIVGGLSVRLI